MNRNKFKTISKHAEVVKIPLCKCIVSPHGITGPPDKVHEIRGTSFDWPDPQRCQISSRPDKKVCEISIRCRKILLPNKVGQSSP